MSVKPQVKTQHNLGSRENSSNTFCWGNYQEKIVLTNSVSRDHHAINLSDSMWSIGFEYVQFASIRIRMYIASKWKAGSGSRIKWCGILLPHCSYTLTIMKGWIQIRIKWCRILQPHCSYNNERLDPDPVSNDAGSCYLIALTLLQ